MMTTMTTVGKVIQFNLTRRDDVIVVVVVVVE